MSLFVDGAVMATHQNGHILIQMESGLGILFPVWNNPRLAEGTDAQLNHIELSPYGLHWPDLDEDLSFRGLIEGDYGQYTSNRTARCKYRHLSAAEPQPNYGKEF